MWPSWMNMLSWWQWPILLAVPPAIISLYFLKLRRRPIEVPSTYLWSRTIEDLHVNSIWQRLRKNLLLLLQLLLVLLIILALLRPAWQGEKLIGHRFIFMIDNSASMGATDVEPTRLEQAKKQALALIDNMESGDLGMVISFADTACIEQMFTGHRAALREAVEAVEPTDRPTSLIEAIKVASAQTMAKQTGEQTDEEAEENLPERTPQSATAYILSDGNFGPLSESSLGNLSPVYIPIGEKKPKNLSILTFCVQRHEETERLQAFARIRNDTEKQVTVNALMELDGNLCAARRLVIEPGQVEPTVLEAGAVDAGVLKLSIRTGDDLRVDDTAWVAVNPVRPSKVLVVTPGNKPLEDTLDTKDVKKRATVVFKPPSYLKSEEYASAAAGAYDLIIYDRCMPETMPQANTILFGNAPLGGAWDIGETVPVPQIVDIDQTHPLMHWLAMDDVLLAEGRPLKPPAAGRILLESSAGPMMAIAPRDIFEDVAVGFLLVDGSGVDGAPKTNWPVRLSFPLFVLNALEYLGNGGQEPGQETVRPGRPIILDAPSGGNTVSVIHPDGHASQLDAIRSGKYRFSATDQLGVYEVQVDGKTVSRFTVNLLDPVESHLPPRPALNAGPEKIAGQTGWETARREIWRPLLILGLFVLGVEWYIYGQRVSM
jgi:hypothetical protein